MEGKAKSPDRVLVGEVDVHAFSSSRASVCNYRQSKWPPSVRFRVDICCQSIAGGKAM